MDLSGLFLFLQLFLCLKLLTTKKIKSNTDKEKGKKYIVTKN